jgi:HSP20 family protein
MAIRPPRAGFSVSRRLSERARAARAKPPQADSADIFGALRGLVEQFTAAAKGNAESFSRSFELGGDNAKVVFGYTLRMGPDGVDAEPFGNVPADRSEVAPPLQPITEVFLDGDAVVVVAELPGADPGGIVCRPGGARLLIETTGARRYRKDLKLPAAVRPDGIAQTYRNGILEVRMTKAGAP